VKTYRITIEPLSPFGTPLKGDTLFGQFCWQAAYDETLLSISLNEAVERYGEKPFAIFSSAFPLLPDGAVALPRPQAPLDQLFDLSGIARDERVGRRKELKKRKWLICGQSGGLPALSSCRYLDDRQLGEHAGVSTEDGEISREFIQSHNSINRLTGTTGEGFAPFSGGVTVYAPGLKLAVIVGVDPDIIGAEELRRGLERIGATGFGRDASTGNGRFRVCDCREVDLHALGAPEPNALYTLAPCVPEKGKYRDILFTPFTRFGRHGDHLATGGKPYKNPVIMADEGALLFPQEPVEAMIHPWIGTALSGLSKVQEHTVVAQGYSLYIPVRLEVRQ
jgi:CRISPR-associated protein Csm4